MRKLVFVSLILSLFSIAALAQNPTKPWTEWTKKDAEKMLNDSAWGQTQTTGGSQAASTSAITATQGAGREGINRTGESGETLGGTKPLNFRVRFLSAKPVREAFSRLVILSKPEAGKELTDQLQAFIDRDFGKYLVVTLDIDSADSRAAGASMGMLGKATVDMLQNKAYLERKDGKRIVLMDYKPPIADNLGAKFIFERTLDGQPFLTEESDTVRFVLEMSDKMKVNAKFKVAAMGYGGKLEY